MEKTMHVQAIYRLATMRGNYPALGQLERVALLDLVCAIMDMDEADEDPTRHSLGDQVRVEEAKDAYAQALADLLRGDEP